jgi:hypothetical protein
MKSDVMDVNDEFSKNEEGHEIELPKGLGEKGDDKDDNFFISARKLFLTYAACPEEWNVNTVRDSLLSLFVFSKGDMKGLSKIKAYVISEERHGPRTKEDGSIDYERGKKHFHCYIELKKKDVMRDPSFADIDGKHGYYVSVKDAKRVINYVKKEGRYISDGFPGLGGQNRALLNTESEMDARLMLMDDMRPGDKVRLRNDYAIVKERKTIIEERVAYIPLRAFEKEFMPFPKHAGFAVTKKIRPIGLLLYGEPKSGKTTLAYRVAKEIGEDLLVVGDPKEMTNHYNGQGVILFDEMDRESFEEYQDLMAGYVTEPHAKTPSYYGNKSMGWPRKVVIATNENIKTWSVKPSIESRFLVVNCASDDTYKFQIFRKGLLKDANKQEVDEILGR